MTRGFDRRRRLATFVAVLALLVQQGLLPVVHYALGGQLAGFAHQTSAGAHMHHHDDGKGGAPADADQGPCHFCRILGAALPPPPVVELARLEPNRAAFVLPLVEAVPVRRPFRAHGVRAPPISSDPLPKIAIV